MWISLNMFGRLVDNHILSSVVTLQLSVVSGFFGPAHVFLDLAQGGGNSFSIVPASLVATAA